MTTLSIDPVEPELMVTAPVVDAFRLYVAVTFAPFRTVNEPDAGVVPPIGVLLIELAVVAPRVVTPAFNVVTLAAAGVV